MKKISIYILLSLIISITALEMTTFAKTYSHSYESENLETQIPDQVGNDRVQFLIATDTEKPKVKPTIIPKPEFLPGPTETEQETKGARSFLVDVILPYLAITLIGFVGGFSLIFLVVGGVRLATAYGNEESIQKGKDQVMYALVGLVIAILSYTIVTIIINLQFKKPKASEDTSQLPVEELLPENGITV